MTEYIPTKTKNIDDVPMESITNLVIVNDTGSKLNYYPNAKGVYSDHTGKEFTSVVTMSNGEVDKIYCGNIVFAGDPTDEAAPSPSEIIDMHNSKYSDRTGEWKWGHVF